MAGLERLGEGGSDRHLTSEENPPIIVRQLLHTDATIGASYCVGYGGKQVGPVETRGCC